MALRPIVGGRATQLPPNMTQDMSGAAPITTNEPHPLPPGAPRHPATMPGGSGSAQLADALMQQQQQQPQFQQPQPAMQQPQSLPPDQQRFMDLMTSAGVPAERFTGSPPAGLADAYRSGANLPQNDLMRMAQWGSTGYWPGGMGEIWQQSQAGDAQNPNPNAGGGDVAAAPDMSFRDELLRRVPVLQKDFVDQKLGLSGARPPSTPGSSGFIAPPRRA